MAAESWWTTVAADEWGDAIVAAMKLGGVDNLFFVSGSELNFYQEAIAKARALDRPAPNLVTMTPESVSLNAALGHAIARRQPAAAQVDAAPGAAVHTAWRGGYPVLMTAGRRTARLCRFDDGGGRGAVRPTNDRSAIHEDGPPVGAPGQSRAAGESPPSGGDERRGW